MGTEQDSDGVSFRRGGWKKERLELTCSRCSTGADSATLDVEGVGSAGKGGTRGGACRAAAGTGAGARTTSGT